MFIRPLGLQLSAHEKESFDNIRERIDRCTNEIMVRPDWGENFGCVDAMNSAPTQATINEAFAALKRKFSSRTHTVVLLALHLAETIVKNCGDGAHRALNDESFLKELGRVAKKYNGKNSDATSREIAELSLDIIQTWGEAFLPRSAQYPNIPKLYHDLRKDGLQFRAQYDETRVPIFTPPPVIPDDPEESRYGSGVLTTSGGEVEGDGDIDADLAAAMALSLAENGPPPQTDRDVFGMASTHAAPPPSRPSAAAGCSRTKSTETITGCQSSMAILKEIVLASSSTSELRDNDIADEVASQLRTQHSLLMRVVEEELAVEGEGISDLFQLNDDVTFVLETYSSMKSGVTRFMDGQSLLSSMANMSHGHTGGHETKADTPSNTPAETSTRASGNELLDIFGTSSNSPEVDPSPSAGRIPEVTRQGSGSVMNMMHMPQSRSVAAAVAVEVDVFGDVIPKPHGQPQSRHHQHSTPQNQTGNAPRNVPVLPPPGSGGRIVAPAAAAGLSTTAEQKERPGSQHGQGYGPPAFAAPITAPPAQSIDVFDDPFFAPAAPPLPNATGDLLDDLTAIASRADTSIGASAGASGVDFFGDSMPQLGSQYPPSTGHYSYSSNDPFSSMPTAPLNASDYYPPPVLEVAHHSSQQQSYNATLQHPEPAPTTQLAESPPSNNPFDIF